MVYDEDLRCVRIVRRRLTVDMAPVSAAFGRRRLPGSKKKEKKETKECEKCDGTGRKDKNTSKDKPCKEKDAQCSECKGTGEANPWWTSRWFLILMAVIVLLL